MKTQTEADRKVGWAVQKAHTQFPDPISEDDYWAPFVGSSCCKSVLNFTRMVTLFSNQSLSKDPSCIPSGP